MTDEGGIEDVSDVTKQEITFQSLLERSYPRSPDMQWTVRLDPGFRPRFHSSAIAPAPDALALVPLVALAEAAPLGKLDDERAALEAHTAVLVTALLREFRAQSPRFRALREHA